MTGDLEHIWSAIQDELRQAVPADTVRASGSRPLRRSASRATTARRRGPARAARLGRRALRAACLQASVAAVLGPEVTRRRALGASTGRRAGRRRQRAETPARAPEHHGINPNLTFEQFVIGDGNRFAHAAALAVAELPGQAYNPLFIYGPPGVGKTHLLHSIGNYVARLRRRPQRPLHDGRGLHQRSSSPRCSGGDIDALQGRYRRADVLLIDDVQFLAAQGARPRRSSSTPSTRCTTPAASSC